MKTKTIITDITHEDLVDLFSTATYGSNYLSLAFINEDDYYGTKLEDSEDCWEDKFTKVLLDGGCIEVLDYYAEDEDDFNGDKPHRWNGQCMAYTIGLQTSKRVCRRRWIAKPHGTNLVQETLLTATATLTCTRPKTLCKSSCSEKQSMVEH